MPFYVTVGMRKTGFYVVNLEGRLDSNTYPILEKRVTPLLVSSTKALLFDMGELDYISSAGIRIVFIAKKAMSEHNGSFGMINLKPQIRKVFDIINALPEITVFKNVEEADRYLDILQKREIEKQEES